MAETVKLERFDRILSGYEKLTEIAVSISDCSRLSQKYRHLGVQGYRLGDYRGVSYLNRYLNCSVQQAPMFIYKRHYLIPLVFRKSADSFRLFEEPMRMTGFFYLLDWYLENDPKKVVVIEPGIQKIQSKEIVIDSAFLSFRLSEILDGAGFPISEFTDLEEFIDWNRVNRLIDNGGIGRHSRIFDIENPRNLSELKVILEIIQLKYPALPLLNYLEVVHAN